jgi:hypothetical protein
MTALDKVESKISKVAKVASYRGRQLEKLVDGSAWEFTGETIEAKDERESHCELCGAKLRYRFLIRCTKTVENEVGRVEEGKTLWIGCVCLSNHQGVNPEMVAAIQAKYNELLEKQRKAYQAARKAAKEAALDAEIQQLHAKWQSVIARMEEEVSKYPRGKAPYALWYATRSWYALPREIPAYGRKHLIRNFLKRQLAKWESVAKECGITLD